MTSYSMAAFIFLPEQHFLRPMEIRFRGQHFLRRRPKISIDIYRWIEHSARLKKSINQPTFMLELKTQKRKLK